MGAPEREALTVGGVYEMNQIAVFSRRSGWDVLEAGQVPLRAVSAGCPLFLDFDVQRVNIGNS
jgi:hypothetical protein